MLSSLNMLSPQFTVKQLTTFLCLLVVANISSFAWLFRGDFGSSLWRETAAIIPSHDEHVFIKMKKKKQKILDQRDIGASAVDITKTQMGTEGVDGSLIVAGLVQDTQDVQPKTWDLLIDLSCNHNVPIHIIAQIIQQPKNDTTGEEGETKPVSNSTSALYDDLFCGYFTIEQQDQFLTKGAYSDLKFQGHEFQENNRLIRLGQVRDAHRQRIRELFFPGYEVDMNMKKKMEASTIIVTDLDLWDTPDASSVMHRAQNMQGADAVCSLGTELHHQGPGGYKKGREKLYYYDTFASVFWPDTYGYPKEGRLFPYNYPTEELKKKEELGVVVPDWDDWYEYLLRSAENETIGMAPARSCFGGLTLYRARVWLERQCQHDLFSMVRDPVQYSPPRIDFNLSKDPRPQEELDANMLAGRAKNFDNGHETNILRYASKKEMLVCEHIILHDCLHRTVFTDGLPHMFIDPSLRTQWRSNSNHPRHQQAAWQRFFTKLALMVVGCCVVVLLVPRIRHNDRHRLPSFSFSSSSSAPFFRSSGSSMALERVRNSYLSRRRGATGDSSTNNK